MARSDRGQRNPKRRHDTLRRPRAERVVLRLGQERRDMGQSALPDAIRDRETAGQEGEIPHGRVPRERRVRAGRRVRDDREERRGVLVLDSGRSVTGAGAVAAGHQVEEELGESITFSSCHEKRTAELIIWMCSVHFPLPDPRRRLRPRAQDRRDEGVSPAVHAPCVQRLRDGIQAIHGPGGR